MDGGKEDGDLRAQRMADDVDSGQVKCIAQRKQIVGMIGDAVAVRRCAAT
jgi:hypothetical protein